MPDNGTPMRSAVFCLVGILATCLVPTATARAQQASTTAVATAEGVPADVLDLLRRGVELRVAGDDAGALLLFEQARQLAPELGRVRGQIGLAQHALGRWVDAEGSLELALRSDDPWVARHRAELAGSLEVAGAHVGTLVVTADEGVEVSVDDSESWAFVPIDVRVAEGPHVVRARRAGHLDATREVEVVGGQRAEIAVSLAPVPDVRLPDGTQLADAPTEPMPPETPPDAVAPAPHEAHALVWVGLATTLAAAGALIGTHVAASDRQTSNQAQLDGACVMVTDTCRSLRDTLQGQLQPFEIAMDALWGVLALGATLGGVGLVLTFVDEGHTELALGPSSLRLRW